ncbi:hypothetical protein O7635_10010 [Asanoa sp. WMMD1127]|uniref:hypothetical protein n=1 Tax=Asanoa sp. WMMD1127 TaxID=3016107 RepID=UPI002417D88A|nr:hypothetical protein [Asanoa sp. WMMD1127]MDG4822186.1 hypothetical protein [Asanoa sp. WMMD1127]
MSYDLMFLRRQPGQGWEEALEAAEDYQDFGAGPDDEIWQRVLNRAKLLLGEVSTWLTDDAGEIIHERTGIQLTLYADSAEMSVPYGDTGDAATAVLRTMFLLGQVVEEETGLEGFDPQVDMPIREAAANLDLGAASFEMVARMLSRPGGATAS